MTKLTGKTIAGRYHITSHLCNGETGEVYKVWDNIRSVSLAMKVFYVNLDKDPVFLRRFQRGARALHKLQHPNLVRFYSLEQSDNLVFMLMDLIEGTTLRQELFETKKTFSNERILEIMRPICSALHYVHYSGLVHLGIKPANIMINKKGNLFISNLNLVRHTDSSSIALFWADNPAYMPPEQIQNERLTPQSDIYALGILLFEMLTSGEKSFIGKNEKFPWISSEKVQHEQVLLSPPPPSTFNPVVTTSLDNIVLKCLEKNPSNRYSSTIDLRNDLEICTKSGS